MKNGKEHVQRVATILRNWKGSDAGGEASPNEVAAEIDQAYAEHLDSLLKQTATIRQGQKEWEQRVA